MDPEANLEEQLTLALKIINRGDELDHEDADRLAELVLAMNDWLVGGGAKPQIWK